MSLAIVCLTFGIIAQPPPPPPPPPPEALPDVVYLWSDAEESKPPSCEVVLLPAFEEMTFASNMVWSPREDQFVVVTHCPVPPKEFFRWFPLAQQMQIVSLDGTPLRRLGPGRPSEWTDDDRISFSTRYAMPRRTPEQMVNPGLIGSRLAAIEATVDLSEEVPPLPEIGFWQSSRDQREDLIGEKMVELGLGDSPQLFGPAELFTEAQQMMTDPGGTATRYTQSGRSFGLLTDVTTGSETMISPGPPLDETTPIFRNSLVLPGRRLLVRPYSQRTATGGGVELEELRVVSVPETSEAEAVPPLLRPAVVASLEQTITIAQLAGAIPWAADNAVDLRIGTVSVATKSNELFASILNFEIGKLGRPGAKTMTELRAAVVRLPLGKPEATAEVILDGWPGVGFGSLAATRDGRRLLFSSNAHKVIAADGVFREADDLLPAPMNE